MSAARLRRTARGERPNARLGPADLQRHARLDDTGRALLERATGRLALSERARQRVQRVARTIADLDGADDVAGDHLAEALSYRGLAGP